MSETILIESEWRQRLIWQNVKQMFTEGPNWETFDKDND
jgi:hypothetical protein